MAIELTNPQIDRSSLSPEGQVFEISKSVTFEAAHRLPGRGTGDPYGRIHGHSFKVEARVAGEVQPGEKWVEDLGKLTAALEKVAARLDHQLLNEIEGLSAPTFEVIALWIADKLKPELPGLTQVTISRPSLDETCTLRL
ncbi:MAG: 6-carboxytetrahydropterin synthase [Pseudomonadota bacterium]